ncbi:MAG: DsbA family protein [Patescibacteria group bacterium]|mgnify:FL=1
MGERNLIVPSSIVVAGVIVAAAVVYVGGGFGPKGSGNSATAGGGAPNQTQSGGQTPADLSDDDPVLGNPDAPVTMIEFSDFQCPFCGRFWQQTLPAIKAKYIETGTVKFVYRDFPISSIHSEAEKAAEAGECADEQGKFWEYHDRIFQGQDELGEASLKRWAAELGLNAAQFNTCLDSGKYTDEVAKDFQDGQAAGVTGTPTFFINGQSVVGALPFAQFQTILDAALKQ